MEKITLNDGREFDVLFFALATSGYLFISVNMSIGEAAAAFSHGTEKITYIRENGETIAVSGFTELSYIVNEADCVRVALIRPLVIEPITS